MQDITRRPTSIIHTGLIILIIMPLILAGCQRHHVASQSRLMDAAKANLEHGHFNVALAELSQVLAEDPDNIEVHINLAWVYLYTDELEKASTEIKYVTAHAPNDPRLHYLKGALYARLEQWADALSAYNDALKTSDAKNPDLHFDIANAFLAVNEPEAALKEFDVALRLEPKNSSFDFGKCQAYRQLKLYDRALMQCQTASDETDDAGEKGRISEVMESITLLRLIDKDHETPTDETQAESETDKLDKSASTDAPAKEPNPFAPDNPQGTPED